MKKNSLYTIIIAATTLMMITSCQDTDIDGIVPVDHSAWSVPDKTDGLGTLYPDQKLLFGKTNQQWSAEWWKTVMSYDCAHNPLNLQSLSITVNQASPVVFLTGVTSGIAVRTIEVSRAKALLVPIINVLKEYPSANTDQNPRPGQTVEQFLKAEAAKYINLATNMKVVLDGRPIRIESNNRVATDLFYFKGNKDLAGCIGQVVTGQLQVGVSDGYWIVIENLSPGRHTLHTHAEILATGIVPDVYYNIVVR
ncbi:MAG: hypothetical protein ABJB16_04195 [Saprospiraceae bacterium]